SLAALNTAVDVPAVAQGFQAVRDAQAAGPLYRGLLAGLSESVRKAAAQGAAQSDVTLAQTMKLAEQDLDTTAQIAAAFHRDPEGHVEGQIARMLAEPIIAARTVLSVGGPAEWNARASDLCSRLKPVLSKYPFTPGASAHASIQEIVSVFRPADGLLWKFYNESLKKLIERDGQEFVAKASAGLAVNPAFLSFLDRSGAFSDAAFAGGASQPKFRYTLRPIMPPDIDSVKLTVDGQSATFRGSATAKAFTWPGRGAQEMRVNVKFKGKGEYNWNKSDTPWSVLLFFDGASRRQGAHIE